MVVPATGHRCGVWAASFASVSWLVVARGSVCGEDRLQLCGMAGACVSEPSHIV